MEAKLNKINSTYNAALQTLRDFKTYHTTPELVTNYYFQLHYYSTHSGRRVYFPDRLMGMVTRGGVIWCAS